jgi:hypothetical protein
MYNRPSFFGKQSRVARFFLVQHTKTGKNLQNDQKIYQMAINFFQWPNNRPNLHKIYPHFQLEYPPKFTQIGIFGLKTNHLASLKQSCLDLTWYCAGSLAWLQVKQTFEVITFW